MVLYIICTIKEKKIAGMVPVTLKKRIGLNLLEYAG